MYCISTSFPLQREKPIRSTKVNLVCIIMWRPGEKRPDKKKKKKQQKVKSKSISRAQLTTADQKVFSNDQQKGNDTSSKRKRPRERLQQEERHAKVTKGETDFLRVGDGNLMTALGKSYSKSPSGSNGKFSSSLRGLKFMAKKEEAKKEAEEARRIRDAKWVIDRSLLGEDTEKLVCEALETAPSRWHSGSRRSFGFNKVIEAHERHSNQVEQDAVISEQMANEAKDAQQMADYFSRKSKLNHR